MTTVFVTGLPAHQIDIDRAEVEACTDEQQLRDWYIAATETAEVTKVFTLSHSDLGLNDESRLRSAGQKVGFCQMAAKWVERRMLTLGYTVPYPPSDPRSREISRLHKQANDARKYIAELEAKVAELEAA